MSDEENIYFTLDGEDASADPPCIVEKIHLWKDKDRKEGVIEIAEHGNIVKLIEDDEKGGMVLVETLMEDLSVQGWISRDFIHEFKPGNEGPKMSQEEFDYVKVALAFGEKIAFDWYEEKKLYLIVDKLSPELEGEMVNVISAALTKWWRALSIQIRESINRSIKAHRDAAALENKEQ